MKRYFAVSLLLSLFLALLVALVVRAKLPSGYGHTRGLYMLFDNPEAGFDPPQYPIVGGVMRYNWSDMEPENGNYDWVRMDNWIQREQQHGKLAAIGFSFVNEYRSQSSDRGLQIPTWLPSIDPNVRWRNTLRNPEVWYVANYWNSTFRNYYQRFINAFAQHLADNPNLRDRVAWVSMGVGLSGETQPSSRWVPEEKPDWDYYASVRGITQDQWVEYVNWCSNMYKQAFASRGMNIPLFLDIGPTYIGGPAERAAFSGYAASIGVGLRHNGLKADHPTALNYLPMTQYSNTVPIAWETYANYLPSKADVFWGFMCGLSKHPDNFSFDRLLWQTEEYLDLLRFAARYCGVTVSNTPGAWVALRDTQEYNGEHGNFSLFLTQKDDAPNGRTVADWNKGQSRGYKFDVPNGTYQVELHFAEVYYNAAGARVFDIKIENVVVQANFDIWSAAGGKNRAVVRTLNATVSDGRLDIDFVPKTADEPTIHAIKVSGPGYTQRINCGGVKYPDGGGNIWAADREYETGSFGYIGGGVYSSFGNDIVNTNEDYLYQTMRMVTTGTPAYGRFARRTDQATGNTRMRFDIDNSYMYYGSFSTATITVTYFATGTDRWQLKYDAIGNGDKAATPVGSTDPWVQKDNSGLWKRVVFYLTDARFANGQPGYTDFSIDCLGDGDEWISFVEVTKDSGSSPGPTPTPTTVPCTLRGCVQLQSRPAPPHTRWSVPLTVTVGSTNYAVTTDVTGCFTVTGLTPGTYDIRVKNSHTLSNLRRNYALATGINEINMGELKEGDANNSDRIDSSDFLLLRSSYLKSIGQPGFIASTDFNEDGIVNSSDFLLLRSNYLRSGPIELSGAKANTMMTASFAQAPDMVSIVCDPQFTIVNEGDSFDLDIRVDASTAEIVVADIYLNFDPSKIEVIEISEGQVLPLLAAFYNNSIGTVDIGAGTLGAPVTGSFILATLHFQAKASTQENITPVAFALTAPRQSVVKDANDRNLLGTSSDGAVSICAAAPITYSLYLPVVQLTNNYPR